MIYISPTKLAGLFVSGVEFSQKFTEAKDAVTGAVKRLEECGAFLGQRGEQFGEICKKLARLFESQEANIKQINNALDNKIGVAIENDRKKNFDQYSDKVLQLLQRRLKK